MDHEHPRRGLKASRQKAVSTYDHGQGPRSREDVRVSHIPETLFFGIGIYIYIVIQCMCRKLTVLGILYIYIYSSICSDEIPLYIVSFCTL